MAVYFLKENLLPDITSTRSLGFYVVLDKKG
jgi:hypothetical protein